MRDKFSTDSQEALRHDTPRDHYINHDSPLSGDGSHKASGPNTAHDQYRSNESPKSGDVLSISNVVGNQKQKVASSAGQINHSRKTTWSWT